MPTQLQFAEYGGLLDGGTASKSRTELKGECTVWSAELTSIGLSTIGGLTTDQLLRYYLLTVRWVGT
jgi:hypothetical protein